LASAFSSGLVGDPPHEDAMRADAVLILLGCARGDDVLANTAVDRAP
jgi:hypothetical protein